MTRTLPEHPDLDQYRRQARELLRGQRAGDPAAVARIRDHHPRWRRAEPEAIRAAAFALADAQLVLARELGFAGWPRLKAHVEGLLAGEVRAADRSYYWYSDRAGRTLRLLRAGGPAACEAARRWIPRLADASDAEIAAAELDIGDGRLVVAREHGFLSWADFTRHLEATGQGPHDIDRDPGNEADEGFADAAAAIAREDERELSQRVAGDPGLAQRRGARGRSLLHFAAEARSAALVDALIAAGADPNAADEDGWTPLHQAAYGEPPEQDPAGQQRSLDVMERLLAAGADLEAESRGSGGTPLLQALFWGHRSLAERLARVRIAPLNLRTAAALGRLDLAQGFFLEDGSLRPEAGRRRGYAAPHSGFPDFTPRDDPEEVLADALVYAALNGRLAAVDLLLDRGADPDASAYQETPLFAAVRKGHADVAARLLERGADVDARGDWAAMTRLTALHHAVSVGRLDMVRFLVERGADLGARDEVAQGTPVEWARHFECPDIEAYLARAAASG